MADHRGFAGALTVRENVFNTALAAAYANGTFRKELEANLPGDGPTVEANLFLGQPAINCEQSTNLLVLTLPTWGSLTVTRDNTEYDVEIVGELEVTLKPVFFANAEQQLELSPNPEDIIARRWTATVISAGIPPEIVSHVEGDEFRIRLESAIRFALGGGLVKLPALDISFFGRLNRFVTTVEAKVLTGVLLLGINAEDLERPIPISINGNIGLLQDFAGGHDLAGVLHKDAAIFMFDELYAKMKAQVEHNDATLESNFRIRSLAGYYQVSGTVSKTGGDIDFSFHIVPYLSHIRPGKYFQYLDRPVMVRSREWPVLDFQIENLHTDIERSLWVIVFGELIGGLLTGGFLFAYIETKFIRADSAFSGGVRAAKLGAPRPRVIKTIPPPGGIAVRVGVDRFEINNEQTYIGISVRSTSSGIKLAGPTVVPADYANEKLRYILSLPSAAFISDPALRVRWTVEDRTNNTIVFDEDSRVANHMKTEIKPSNFPGASDFGITARLYRRTGTIVTELGIASVNLHIRGTLSPGGYIRWLTESSNPQVTVNEETDEWQYAGELRVRRWSEWHRTDAPCKSVNVINRYRFNIEVADRFPFELRLLESHRKGLCPYCFYGGPAGANASL